MAERRSKANALSALGTARGANDAVAPPNPALHATRKAQRLPRLPRLRFEYMADDESVDKTLPPIPTAATSVRQPPPRTKPRLFGLEEAPVFFPTWEEFQHPMQYIQWVASPEGGNGVAYGLAKIVPPAGWAPEFVVDQDTFRFRTRVQRLSEVSAEGRVAQNYEEQLCRFHAQQGLGQVAIPRVDGRRVPVYALKQAVKTHGDSWDAVADEVGMDGASAGLSEVYAQVVAPFEAFLERTAARRRAGELREPPAHGAICAVCRKGGDGPKMLLCDECNVGMHMYCLDPPLKRVPQSEWYCPKCLANTGGDYGFEDGETHSLHSFWRRCEAFAAAWWAQKGVKRDPEESVHDAEDRIEAEFWRLVHSTDEHVDVEYGADVHSSTHGNAAPTVEQQPLSAYARSGWNLNNMPILPESLLRYIKTEISGMTVPWIYIGMMFSAFCWHNEDHYTYSVNYQHWGATKTWYGVPGADAERFEAAMRATAPELFDSCPDLLLQLVTMMSPEHALRHGARVYAVNQRANEFVLTFPKAYHSGLNQGFNLNEAVNFALPDWIMDGLECVHKYQVFHRQPVFSHDELLVTIAQHSQHLSTAVWLQHAYREMVDRELAQRRAVQQAIADALGAAPVTLELDERDRPEREYQCAHCRMYCYLSQITAPGADVACLTHGREVCGAPARWTLRVRLSDAYLLATASRLAERASVPDGWQQRVRRLLSQHARPPLRTLRALVHEGERIAHPLPELAQLRDFVRRAEPWVEQAQVFLTRRHAKKRGDAAEPARRRKRSPTPDDAADRSPATLLALCAQVDRLPFEAPELQGLHGVVEQLQTTAAAAAAYIGRDPETRDAHAAIDSAEQVLEQGALLSVDIPQLDALRRWIAHARWFAEVREIGTGFLSLQEVDELRAEGAACGVADTHPCMAALGERRAAGVAWGESAERVLASEQITRAMLDELLDVPPTVAVCAHMSARVHALLHKAAGWAESIVSIHSHTHPRPRSEIPMDTDKTQARLAEARRVLAAARAAHFQIAFADDIAAAIELHDRWNDELAHILQATDYRARPEDDVVALAHRFCTRTTQTAATAEITAHDAHTPGAPCICAGADSGARIACTVCGHTYHMACLEMRGRAPKAWTCPLCDTDKLVALLQRRRALSQLPLVALLQNPAFQPDKFRFLPANYMPLQAAVRATVEFGVAVAMRFRTGALPGGAVEPVADMHIGAALEHAAPAQLSLLRTIMRRAVGCPVDILLIAEAMPRENVPTALEALAPFFHVPRKVVTPKRGIDMRPRRAHAPQAAPGRMRVRSRRARFVFREEPGPLRPGEEPTQYCICKGPSTGAMVMCDKCTHWFHNECMFLDDTAALQDKWFCPICCIRMRRRYPTADVRIRDATPAACAHPPPPGIYVDYFASLHSELHPVPKAMRPPIGPQITLHLAAFIPAILAHDDESPAPKRARVDASDDKRQMHVRENLCRRGVSDAMIRTFAVGWDGESIVVRVAPELELRLGPRIELAPGDPDGTQLVRLHYERFCAEARTQRPPGVPLEAPTTPPAAPAAPLAPLMASPVPPAAPLAPPAPPAASLAPPMAAPAAPLAAPAPPAAPLAPPMAPPAAPLAPPMAPPLAPPAPLTPLPPGSVLPPPGYP